jgi:hypothetical protein
MSMLSLLYLMSMESCGRERSWPTGSIILTLLKGIKKDDKKFQAKETNPQAAIDKEITPEWVQTRYLSIYGSTAVVDLGRFFSFLVCSQSVEILGRGSVHSKDIT